MGYPAVAATLCVYGVFLAACGYYGAWSHEFAPKVMHSLYAGVGGGAAVSVCGVMCLLDNKCGSILSPPHPTQDVPHSHPRSPYAYVVARSHLMAC
jgi:hypothetical protein